MRLINLLTLIFVIAGGLDMGVEALGRGEVIAATFGEDTWLTKLFFGLIGVSALWQLVPYTRAVLVGELAAEADLPAATPRSA